MIQEKTSQIVGNIPDAQYIVEKVRSVLKKYKKEVAFAFLFGSYAAGKADNWSDIDIGIYLGKGVPDDKRNEIRFKIMDELEPLEVQIGYLDDEYTSPAILVAAAEGLAIVINDEEIYFEELIKNIHTLEEMKLIGIAE
ncbi:MAG: nucleotidyltransferase domain-containing protein [Nitrospirae bacterium]|nr:nucleotidyltransferase domain-containing protein [Nitrospirota bacterium]